MKRARVRLTLSGLLVGWLVWALNPATPTSQQPISPLTVTATEAADLRHTIITVQRGQRDQHLRVTDVVQDPLLPTHAHQRLAQYHQDIPVLGAELTMQVASGVTTSAFGQLYPDIVLDVVPRLSAEEALRRLDPAGVRGLTLPPRLVVIPDAATSSYRLAYELQTFGPDGLLTTQVDATTGRRIAERYAVRTQTTPLPCGDCAVGAGLGVKGDRKKISVRARSGEFTADDGLRPARVSTYDMAGNWSRTIDVLLGRSTLTEGDLAADRDNDWRDGVNVDGHVGAGWTLDYVYHRFGLAGLDGRSSPVVVLVHPIDRADFFTAPDEVVALFHANAFYCGTCGPFGMTVLGEGLPPGRVLGTTGLTLDFFAAGLDIVAHELGHAVTESSSRLINEGESGALSEAFSDIVGVGVEFFMAESGRHPAEQTDYLVGEDVVRPGGIRSLANPLAKGDPDHYSLRFLGAADNGGVHTNSTIVSHVYYLVVEGGVNTTSGLAVSGLGAGRRDLVEQIFYRAFSLLLPASATFSMARAATLQSARDLTADDTVEQTMAAAWTAVGVE